MESNIKTLAMEYEIPGKLLNISEATKISVDAPTVVEEKTNNEGEKYTIIRMTYEEKDYRLPVSVLEQLKELLVEYPDLKFFKVKKQGTGMETKYQAIPVF